MVLRVAIGLAALTAATSCVAPAGDLAVADHAPPATALAKAGLYVDQPVGVSFSPLSGRWSLGNDTAVNYMMVARKAP